MDQARARDLLFADVALMLGAAPAHIVAAALQSVWEGKTETIADALEIDQGKRDAVRVEVERLVTEAEGDASTALAQRGGIDRSIHTSMGPQTSHAMIRDGVGARAPLRELPADRYEDFRLIGEGGMGAVYLAMDTELHREVAFKMVRPDSGGSATKVPLPDTPLRAAPPTVQADGSRTFEELTTRFLQEAWITGALEHPGVVPVYSLGRTSKGIPFYTMRYVKGERTLGEALKQCEDLDDRLALIEPFLKVCDTIRYAHSRDIIHRDLKPENIALGEFGEVVVLDWGLSKMQDQPDISGSIWRARIAEFREAGDLQTVAGVMGTPGYMAPEAALGKSDEVGAQADVYSLGAILYEILAGRIPFAFKTYLEYVQQVLENKPTPPHDVNPGVPEELSAVCARALAKDVADRYESVDALAQEVRRWHTEGRLAREVDELVQGARSELKAAAGLHGNMALWHLDRASAACTRALHMHANQPDAMKLLSEIKRLREQAIRERVRSNRQRALFVGGFVVLALAAVVTLWIAKARADERETARLELNEVKETAAASERAAKAARVDAHRAHETLANSYADQAQAHLDRDWVAAARLSAIRAILTAPTPRTWAVLAAAETRWTPTLRASIATQATAMAFAPDGKTLFAGGPKGAVVAIHLASGQVRPLGKRPAPVNVIEVSPDGKYVAAGSRTGLVRVWRTQTKKLVGKYPEQLSKRNVVVTHAGMVHEGARVTAIAFHDERLFVAYDDTHTSGMVTTIDRVLRHWNLEHDDVGVIDSFENRLITSLAIGPSGDYLFAGDTDGTVARLSISGALEGGTMNSTLTHITSIQVAPDGASFYGTGRNHRVVLMDIERGREVIEFRGPEHKAAAVALSPDRRFFFAADPQGTLRVWSRRTGKVAATIEGWSIPVRALAMSPDSGLLAVARVDGTVRLWDLTMGWGAAATAVHVTTESKRTYVARPDFGIEVWDADGGRLARTLRGHRATITCLARGGTRLYSASLDGRVHEWDLRTGRSERDRGKEGAPVTAMTVRGVGELFTGGLDGLAHAWPAKRGRPVPLNSDRTDVPITAMAAARDVTDVVFGDADGTVRVARHTPEHSWVTPAGVEIGGTVVAVAIADDGKHLAAATNDQRLHLWPADRPDARRSVALATGQTLVRLTVGADGDARWWYADHSGGRTRGTQVNAVRAGDVKPARVLGSRLTWVLQDPTRRLIGAENRFGLKLVGATVRAVPQDEYDPSPTRLAPWSK